ncbi:D-2-hydroxyacid dehydrogenase [Holzapfeliella sp. He02]|uniref:D-2-hydroxyacid dehydrogenase n=1 Tax=Holzapfeliella saturejae TaxID=3082953 RepID=A0ABU8SHB6_9LACO
MMFMFYGMRPEEKEYVISWSQQNNVQVKTTAELLTADTVEQAQGADGIVALQTQAYPKEVFDKMGQMGIKSLSLRNVGTDNVDKEAAKANHIRISNVPAYSPNAIAEFAVSSMMQLLRQTRKVIQYVEDGQLKEAVALVGKELSAQTVGVVGTGRIGKRVVDILQGMGAKVIAYDPAFHQPDIDYVDNLDDLLKQVDILTLHIPGMPATEHLINEKNISLMKPGSYLVNDARGMIVETRALINALKEGRLAGAALDTFENEDELGKAMAQGQDNQDPDYQTLKAMDNVILTPHIAYHTDIAVHNMVHQSLDSAYQFSQGQDPENEVKF